MESPKYSGMTVNERLVLAGLMEEFDAAVHARDVDRAMKVLERVEMTPEQAEETVHTILENPKLYGY